MRSTEHILEERKKNSREDYERRKRENGRKYLTFQKIKTYYLRKEISNQMQKNVLLNDQKQKLTILLINLNL